MKKRTVILVSIFTLALMSAGGYGAYRLMRNTGTPVEVFSVASLNQGYWGESMSSGGTITSKATQEVYLNSSETINEIYVQEGDKVKVGDKLMSYDTTLAELNLEGYRLEAQAIALEIKGAEKDLQKLKSTTPIADSAVPDYDDSYYDDDFDDFDLEDWDEARIVPNKWNLTAASDSKRSETESETQKVTEAETQKAPETESEAETQKAPETELEAETQKAPETEPEAEMQKAPETELEAETQKAPETEPEAETQKAPETEPEAETQKAPETESETETQKAPETEPEAETQKTPIKETEAETQKKPIKETEAETEIDIVDDLLEEESESETEEPKILGEAEAQEFLDEKTKPYKGEGTKEEPYVFLCKDGAVIQAAFLNRMLGFDEDGISREEGGIRKDGEPAYALLEIRENDQKEGTFVKAYLINVDNVEEQPIEEVFPVGFEESICWVLSLDGIEKAEAIQVWSMREEESAEKKEDADNETIPEWADPEDAKILWKEVEIESVPGLDTQGSTDNGSTEATKETTEAGNGSTTESATEPPAEETTEAVTEPVTETITETITEAATETPTEATTEAGTEATTEAVTEAPTELTTESGTEKATESVSESETETETETETSPLGRIKARKKLNYKSKPYKGDGTRENPYVFFCKDGAVIHASFMNKILGFNADGTSRKDGGMKGDGEGCYAVIEIREGDEVSGGFVKSIQIRGTTPTERAFAPDITWIFTTEGMQKVVPEIIEPDTEDDEWLDDDYWDDDFWWDDFEDGYTQSELEQAIKDKEYEIKELKLSLREANLRVQRSERELEEATVLSSIHGVVKKVGNAASSRGEPFILVSSDAGLYVEGTLSELDIDKVHIGSMISGMNYNSGMSFVAEITEISEYPTQNNDYYYGSNSNVSYYPFLAYIEDAEGHSDYDYVELQIQEDAVNSNGSIYLEKAYVRKENGQSYVFIKDKEGKLKKQYVRTGKTVWGSTIEIKEGLSLNDYIAFPYGKHVKEGARTEMDEDDYFGDYSSGGYSGDFSSDDYSSDDYSSDDYSSDDYSGE